MVFLGFEIKPQIHQNVMFNPTTFYKSDLICKVFFCSSGKLKKCEANNKPKNGKIGMEKEEFSVYFFLFRLITCNNQNSL